MRSREAESLSWTRDPDSSVSLQFENACFQRGFLLKIELVCAHSSAG